MKPPELDRIRELRCDLRMEVPADWEDRNGHVNVQYYLALYELGGWGVLEAEGFDEAWFRRSGVSFFDWKHHIRYLAEIRVGDRVSTYTRALDRSEKRFRSLYLIVNDSRGRLAAVLEYETVMVDMRSRRSCAMPAALADALDDLIARHRCLDWPAPVVSIES